MTANPYRRIFQIRAFRLFWLGFTFSVLGDALTRIALTWFVYDLTKSDLVRSAQALGLLALAYTAPIIVGGLVAGSLLDRFDRRTVMIVDNLVRGAAVAVVPLLYALGQLQLWHIYVVAAIYGLLMMIGLAGTPTLIPALVKEEHLDTANALETLSYTLGGVIGPVIAGLLIARIGAPNVVIIDAISYFAFALLLTQIPPQPPQHAHAPSAPKVHLGHAVQLLLKNPVLLATTIMFFAANVGGGGLLSVWLPILSDRVLEGGSELYGSLLGAMAVGEVIGALLAGSRAFNLPLGSRICVAQLLSGLSLLILLVLPNVWVVALGLVLFGIFSAPLTIWAQTLRMHIIPEQLRGRTFALLRTLMQSGNPVGGALGGLLLPLLGIPLMIALSGLVVGIPGILGYGVKALRTAGSRSESDVEAVPVTNP